MEVHFNPDLQTRLTQRATQQGRNPDEWVQDVVARHLDDEERFLAAVEKGIAAAERGEFVEEEEMDARLERMFKP
jgi:predicted transcriptional regulator